MPYVEVQAIIRAPRAQVYEVVKDMPSYPRFMPNLKKVEILERRPGATVTEWVGTVKGATLRWTELDEFDDENFRIHYRQLGGDLKKFEGDWILEETPEGTKVTLTVDFEIGIPMFATMLNPIARLVVRDNAEGMLKAVKERLEKSEGRPA